MNFEEIYSENDFLYFKNQHKSLGKGAFACVFEGKKVCKSSKKEEKIAIKEFNIKTEMSPDIKNEFSTVKDLQHPNILQVYSAFTEKNILIMELCESNIEKLEITSENYISYFKQIVEGLLYLQEKKIIHRDIKPENLLIKSGQIKIADFGISKSLGVDTSTSTFAGSPMFMAPEILRNNTYAYPADIFSLGTTFFHLLYKTTPGQIFMKMSKENEKKRKRDINYLTNMYNSFVLLNFDPFKFAKKPFEIPEELNKLIADCLNNEPQKRPNLKEIFEILTKIENQKPIENDISYFKINYQAFAQGEFASVFEGKIVWKSLKKEENIAIKEFKRPLNSDSEKDFLTVKDLQHPNILQYYCLFKDENCLFMELCESNIEKLRITSENYISYFKQIVEGLLYLQEKEIIHRNIKPQNLLIKNGQIKISDFGISRLLEVDASASTYDGTLMFMAPEILRNDAYSYLADIFSLGTTFFYLLYKITPAQIFIKISKENKEKIRDINYLKNIYISLDQMNFDLFKFVKNPFEIPKELNKKIADCLHYEPEKRPSLKEILEILNEIENKQTSALTNNKETKVDSKEIKIESETQSKSSQAETTSLSSSLITSSIQMDRKMEKENKNIEFLESFYRPEFLNGQKLPSIEEERIKMRALNQTTERFKKEFESLTFQHILAERIKNLINTDFKNPNKFDNADSKLNYIQNLSIILFFLVKLKMMSSRSMYRKLKQKMNIFAVDNKIWEDFCQERNYKLYLFLNFHFKHVSKVDFTKLKEIINHDLATKYGIENQRETISFWNDFEIILKQFIKSNEKFFNHYNEDNSPLYFVLFGLISIIFSKTKMLSIMENKMNISAFDKFFYVKEQRLDAYKIIVNFGNPIVNK